MASLKNRIRKIYYLDNHSIIFSRILIGFLCLYDLVLKLSHLEFYSPELNLFSPAFFEYFRLQIKFINLNIFQFSHSQFFFQSVIFIGIIASAGLIFGIFVNACLIINWIIFLSFKLQVNNHVRSFETLLLLILLMLLLMPKVTKSPLNKKTPKVRIHTTPALLWFVQIILLYFFAGINKLSNPAWSHDFNALEIIFQKLNFLGPLTKHFYFHPILLKFATILTLILELSVPFILIFFFQRQKIRLYVCLLFIFIHIIIMLSLAVGLFTPLSIILWISLIPSYNWNKFFILKNDQILNQFKPIDVIPIFFIVLAIYSNINTFGHRMINFKGELDNFALSQDWSMFAKKNYTDHHMDWIVTKIDYVNNKKKPWDPLNQNYFALDFSSMSQYWGYNYIHQALIVILLNNGRNNPGISVINDYITYNCDTQLDAKHVSIYYLNKELGSKMTKTILLKSAPCRFNRVSYKK